MSRLLQDAVVKLIMVLGAVIAVAIYPTPAQPQSARNLRFGPARLTYEPRAEIETNYRGASNTKEYFVEGEAQGMLPLGDYDGQALGLNFIARYDGDQADIAAGISMLWPGLELGAFSGSTFVFHDQYRYRYGRSDYYAPPVCTHIYDDCTDVQVQHEWMSGGYMRVFSDKAEAEGQVQYSTAYRNSLALDPLYYDGFGNFRYKAKVLGALIGNRENGLLIGAIAERHLGIGAAAELHAKPFDITGAIARDIEERDLKQQLKFSLGGRWNVM